MGLDRLTLRSSATARRFYMSPGYVADGGPTKGFGVTWSYPMAKRLAPKRRLRPTALCDHELPRLKRRSRASVVSAASISDNPA